MFGLRRVRGFAASKYWYELPCVATATKLKGGTEREGALLFTDHHQARRLSTKAKGESASQRVLGLQAL